VVYICVAVLNAAALHRYKQTLCLLTSLTHAALLHALVGGLPAGSYTIHSLAGRKDENDEIRLYVTRDSMKKTCLCGEEIGIATHLPRTYPAAAPGVLYVPLLHSRGLPLCTLYLFVRSGAQPGA